MATEFTEVVVEGVTLAIPRQHNNSDSLASKNEVDIDNDVIQVQLIWNISHNHEILSFLTARLYYDLLDEVLYMITTN